MSVPARPPYSPKADEQPDELLTTDRSGRAWAKAMTGSSRPLGPIARAANAPFIAAIRAYQFTLSPILGRHCRFMPTCSVYSLACFRTHPTHRALWLTTRRVCRCHPLGGKGFDPPPPPETIRPSQDETASTRIN